jgi:hypothetical protein
MYAQPSLDMQHNYPHHRAEHTSTGENSFVVQLVSINKRHPPERNMSSRLSQRKKTKTLSLFVQVLGKPWFAFAAGPTGQGKEVVHWLTTTFLRTTGWPVLRIVVIAPHLQALCRQRRVLSSACSSLNRGDWGVYQERLSKSSNIHAGIGHCASHLSRHGR